MCNEKSQGQSDGAERIAELSPDDSGGEQGTDAQLVTAADDAACMSQMRAMDAQTPNTKPIAAPQDIENTIQFEPRRNATRATRLAEKGSPVPLSQLSGVNGAGS